MIQIIISPAKKMNICEEFPGTATTPVFAEQTDLLYQTLKQMSFEELQKLWKCSEKLALQNTKRLCEFTPADAVTPAVLAYEGIQYQYLAPGIFSDTQWDYVNRHLNILSGFYGVLCPSDAVIPYRLEMQTKLETENATDLYHFWNNQLYQALYCKFEKDSPKELINLASAEYSKAVLPYLTEDVHCVTCVFGEFVQGKVKVKATLAKMARGEMVRWMAEHQIQTAEERISARKIRLFLFCLHFPDLSARDHSAGVSGRLGCHIIRMCVYDNRSSDHILGMKPVCVKDQKCISVICQK